MDFSILKTKENNFRFLFNMIYRQVGSIIKNLEIKWE